MENRTVYGDQRADVLETLGPIAARLAERHGMTLREVLRMVERGAANDLAPPPPPARGGAMHCLLAAANRDTSLPRDAIARDRGYLATRTRRAVIYVARTHAELTYEAIAEGLGIKPDTAVDEYVASIALLENADKGFDGMVRDFAAVLPKHRRATRA